LRPRADGEAYVAAPVSGRLSSGEGFPRIGLKVERGQTLAHLTPSLAEVGDTASLEKTLGQARIAVRQSTQEQARLEKLLAQGVIPERRVVDARFAAARARTALEAARSRRRQAKRSQNTGEQRAEGGFAVRAPLAGTLVSVAVAPGAYVAEGAQMFRVVDLSSLWLEVHVTETHIGQLSGVRGVWFEVEGLGSFEADASEIVTIAGVLDERTRTLPVIVRIPNPDGRLRVGLFASAHVVTGDAREVLAIPRSAVLHEGGLPVAYIQTGGESYERRSLRLGERDGDWVEVREGVAAGERVVSVGAYAVRLAASADQIPTHGHAH
jgi:membrane fusion protein, heavy metal efflux system